MSPSTRRVVVVGYGMAAARLVEKVRERDPDGRRVALTVSADEPHAAYNRVLLSGVLAGTLTPAQVRLHEPGWERAHAVSMASSAVAVYRARRQVELDDGRLVGYDTLVLATGSRVRLPAIRGLMSSPGGPLAAGVRPFRTLDDCVGIVAGVRPGGQVVVLGGGVLGIEAARGLAARGARVTLVHRPTHLMERQLDAGAARVLARRLRDLGVETRTGANAVCWTPGTGLTLDDGVTIPADMLVVATGVRPETGLAEAAGLRTDRGVLVDEVLATSDPHVRAIGDCARHTGAASGLVRSAWDQADVLADLLTGADPAARYRGTPTVTRLKARDVELAALGDRRAVEDGRDDDDIETLRFDDPTRGRYARLALRHGLVTGAIMLGLPDAAAAVTQFYDRQTPVPSDRLALLLGRALPPEGDTGNDHVARLPEGSVICRCNAVSKRALVNAWRRGARTVPALATTTRATTGCGGCHDSVTALRDWLADQDAVTDAVPLEKESVA